MGKLSFYFFLLLFAFVPTLQALATVGASCSSDTICAPYSCKSASDNPSTPSVIEGGFCGGPCTTDAQCAPVATGLGWAAAKCTGSVEVSGTCTAGTTGCTGGSAGPPAVPGTCVAGTAGCTGGSAAVNGVCLELPRSGSKLADTPPATTGAALLILVDTVTNWVFAIFVVIAIIFVLLAAFQFVTAGGEATKVGEARQKLIWAAVGIIIALLSKGLVPVIRAIVGG